MSSASHAILTSISQGVPNCVTFIANTARALQEKENMRAEKRRARDARREVAGGGGHEMT